MTRQSFSTYLRQHIALPSEHGAWVFILSPILIGLFAAGQWSSAQLLLIISDMAAFLLRQPATILVRAYSGRHSQRDVQPALVWFLVYSLMGFALFVFHPDYGAHPGYFWSTPLPSAYPISPPAV